MSISGERNTDLGFDTSALRKAAKEYSKIASELTDMATKLDSLLSMLKSEGWTTKAGEVFHEMTNTNWKENINKYSNLLDTLNSILINAADEYDELAEDYVAKTKVKISIHGGGGIRF